MCYNKEVMGVFRYSQNPPYFQQLDPIFLLHELDRDFMPRDFMYQF